MCTGDDGIQFEDTGNYCFPGSAIVQTPQGPQRMDQLRIGDQVLTLAGFEPIFLFGGRDSRQLAPFIVIETGLHRIEMSADHFIHVQSSGRQLFKRASQVSIGDMIWAEHEGALESTAVVGISRAVQIGLFNPYTPSGTIIVNDVLASVYSRWFLDDACDALGCVACLPSIYQALMVPARFMSFLVTQIGGPGAVEAMDKSLSLTDLGHNYPKIAAASYAAGTSIVVFLTAITFRKLASETMSWQS
ncbi:hypothetical protein WJX74_000263 [Apatococcus lobatus]|uniref:Hint domain-containing protein n=1 Tax=Apatococcus lobatus TaxID=904363 RepID=A0AAW1QC61_9CHLO